MRAGRSGETGDCMPSIAEKPRPVTLTCDQARAEMLRRGWQPKTIELCLRPERDARNACTIAWSGPIFIGGYGRFEPLEITVAN